MTKQLAIIGASYLQLPLIEKAKEMGFVTHVFAWAANDVGERVADFFYPISIVEKDKILEKCEEIGICGICSIASDLAMLTVNYVAEKMSLIGNSMEATYKSTNKHLMRIAFEKNGDPSPRSILVNSDTDIDGSSISYPAIVKPTDRSGSRGIFKIYSKEELKKAIGFALREGFEKKALVEEFVEGDEYSVEYISYHGKHHFLALTKKFTTGAPHFIETGHMQPAAVSDVILGKVRGVVEHALNSLGLENGASHSEIKISDQGDIKIIEIGGRMGGDCIGSDLVLHSTGIDYVRAVIQVACGEEPNLTPVCEKKQVSSRFIISRNDLNEYNELRSKNPKRIIRVAFLDEGAIGCVTDSSNRAGCYILLE